MEKRRTETIAIELEESIMRGDYRDGDRLDEIRLAREFGVSRTPIREAFQKLALSGLIEQIPRRGVFVCQPGAVELIEQLESFEFMAELDSSCGRLAAARISDAGITELRVANRECQSALMSKDTDEYYEHNEVFHRTIYRESGNRVLEQNGPSE